ncbi:uroporphyrinogen-III C-methyltransferase [Rhizobium sp. GR12]|uniref:uroporphyrinogen-III C-methyltransferase n=1 Tax=Rhizobium sp. GR12 TaxID=3053925 RepID=UPI002FBE3641
MSIAEVLNNIAAKGPVFKAGHVWLAGAGPGDVRYLTLEVALALSQAEIIVRDALVSDDVVALGPQAEVVFAGKRGGKPSATQDDITASLIDFARQGKKVLRLKGGDPFIFGRGGEEAEALVRAGIPFRILPGMTSSLAALASARIPATMRGISRAVTLATGHAAGTEEDLDWLALAKIQEPIVVYMGLKNIGSIAGLLMQGGRSGKTPVAVIMSATTAQERIFIGTLESIADDARRENFEAPALIVIGEIVSMRNRLGGDSS